MKDDAIIDLYRQRSEAAITATAEKYGGYCRSISYNILQNKEDSEECVNDTWLCAWRSIPPHSPQCFSAYLGKITRNLSLNRFRQYSAEKRGSGQTVLALSELEECIPDHSSVEQAIDEIILSKAISDFLHAQPQLKRGVFIRRYWFLSPIREIAAACGMSESKITSMLFRMRKELKRYLEKEGITI